MLLPISHGYSTKTSTALIGQKDVMYQRKRVGMGFLLHSLCPILLAYTIPTPSFCVIWHCHPLLLWKTSFILVNRQSKPPTIGYHVRTFRQHGELMVKVISVYICVYAGCFIESILKRIMHWFQGICALLLHPDTMHRKPHAQLESDERTHPYTTPACDLL